MSNRHEAVKVLLEGILTEYLVALSTGSTARQFLDTNRSVTGIVNDYVTALEVADTLRNNNTGNTTDTLRSLRSTLSTMQNRIATILSEVNSTISEALGEELENRTASDEIPVAPFVGSPTPFITPFIDEDDEWDEDEYDDLEEDIDNEWYEESDIPQTNGIHEADDEDDIWEEDDENEDQHASDISYDFGDFTKHPEITEEWDTPENISMTTFIFVRYSHLPYHYTLNGENFKLTISGSDIVSIRA